MLRRAFLGTLGGLGALATSASVASRIPSPTRTIGTIDQILNPPQSEDLDEGRIPDAGSKFAGYIHEAEKFINSVGNSKTSVPSQSLTGG